jgi:hypothetical protein
MNRGRMPLLRISSPNRENEAPHELLDVFFNITMPDDIAMTTQDW